MRIGPSARSTCPRRGSEVPAEGACVCSKDAGKPSRALKPTREEIRLCVWRRSATLVWLRGCGCALIGFGDDFVELGIAVERFEVGVGGATFKSVFCRGPERTASRNKSRAWSGLF